jgi:hypothetical protein
MKRYVGAKTFGAIGASVVAGVFVIAVATSPVMGARGEGGHGSNGARSASHASGGAGRSFSGASGRSAGRVSAHRVSGNRQSRRGRRGAAVYGYSTGHAYSESCAYYYSRALATGSAYWWQLYDDCVGGY